MNEQESTQVSEESKVNVCEACGMTDPEGCDHACAGYDLIQQRDALLKEVLVLRRWYFDDSDKPSRNEVDAALAGVEI